MEERMISRGEKIWSANRVFLLQKNQKSIQIGMLPNLFQGWIYKKHLYGCRKDRHENIQLPAFQLELQPVKAIILKLILSAKDGAK